MSEALFRVGGVYRDGDGDLFRLSQLDSANPDVCKTEAVRCGGVEYAAGVSGGRHFLSDGQFICSAGRDSRLHLIPGELTLVNGEWVSMTPTLDKMEAEKEPTLVEIYEMYEPDDQLLDLALQAVQAAANARMIARDSEGFARAMPTPPAVTPEAPQPTAKPALAALSRVSAQGHRLGLGRSFG